LAINNLEKQEETIKNILLYLISNSKYLTEKRLQKLFYIAEIEFIHRFGQRMSIVDFINHKHGMYSFHIKHFIDCLDDDGKIKSVFKKTKDDYDAHFYHLNKKDIVIELDDERVEILNNILEKFAYNITENIIKYAKSTKPFKETPYGEKIDLDNYVEQCFNESLLKDKVIIKKVGESEKDYIKGDFSKFSSCNKILKYLNEL